MSYHVQVSSPDLCMDPIPIKGQIQRYEKILSPPELFYISSMTSCLQQDFMSPAHTAFLSIYAYRLSKYTWSND